MLVRRSTYTALVLENVNLKEEVQKLEAALKSSESTAKSRVETIAGLKDKVSMMALTIEQLEQKIPKRNAMGKFEKK